MTVYSLKINELNYRIIPTYNEIGIIEEKTKRQIIESKKYLGYTVFLDVKLTCDIYAEGYYFDGNAITIPDSMDIIIGLFAFLHLVRGIPEDSYDFIINGSSHPGCEIAFVDGSIGVKTGKCKQICTNSLVLKDGISIRSYVFDAGVRTRIVECENVKSFSFDVLRSLINYEEALPTTRAAAFSVGECGEVLFRSTSSLFFDFSSALAIANLLHKRQGKRAAKIRLANDTRSCEFYFDKCGASYLSVSMKYLEEERVDY